MLPGSLGTVGLNPLHFDAMPKVRKGLEELVMFIHHQGSLINFVSSFYVISSSRTAVVVLTNSMANNDAPDWLGQLLLEAILDNPNQEQLCAIGQRQC